MINKLLLLLFLIVVVPLYATVDEGEFTNIEQLIEQGEYEDALRFCKKKLGRFKSKDNAMFALSAALYSKAAYNWYDFNGSSQYFNLAYRNWKSLGSPWEDKFVVGVYLAQSAFVCNQPLKALTILNFKANFDKLPTKYLIKSGLIKIQVYNQMGNYKLALYEFNHIDTLINHPEFKSGTTENDNLLFSYLYQKCLTYFDYGDWNKADSLLSLLKSNVKSSNNISFENKILLKIYEADKVFARKDFENAFDKYLNLYNELQVYNDQEQKKLKTLQMAGICAANLGNVTDITKIMRRADMLSISKLGKNHPFVAGLDYLKCYNLYQSGQYNVLLSKLKYLMPKYSFLSKSHPDYLRFFELKAKTEEAKGDLKAYKSTLNLLDGFATSKFGSNNLRSIGYQLSKADIDWRYYGYLNGALITYNKLFKINFANRLHDSSPQRLVFLSNLSTLYEYLDLPDSSAKMAQKAADIAVVNFGTQSPESNFYASLNAYFKFNTGKYTESTEACVSAAKQNQNINAEVDGYLAKACYLQAYIFDWLGEFDLMNKQINKANALALEKDENKYHEKIEMYQSLVKSYISKNNFIRAEKNALALLNLVKKETGEESFLMVDPTLTIAYMKIQKGELKEAEKYLNLSEKVIKKYFSPSSEKWSTYNYTLCKYYLTISDFKRAKDVLQISMDITTKIYGQNHLKLARLYELWANLLIEESRFVDANKMFENAMRITESSLGKSSPAYANLLVQLANLEVKMKEFDKANASLSEAEKFWIAKLGQSNLYIGKIELIRGDLNFFRKKYTESEQSFNKAASIFASIFNKRYNEYLEANVGLAKVAYMKNQYKSAADLLEPVLNERIHFSLNNFSIMSFSQKTNFWAGFREEFELYNSVIYKLIDTKLDVKKSTNLYNYLLKTKGLLLTSDAQIRRQVFQSGDSTLVANYNEWLNQKEYFALVSYYSNEQLLNENISLDKVILKIEDLEKKIQSKSNIDLSANTKEITWFDIRKNLKQNESAVEMVRLRAFNQTFTDTIIYLGLVIDAKTKDYPKSVILKDGKLMEGKYMKYYRNASITKTDDENSYNIFWQPIKELIPDGNTIYFSSDGVYAQINPEMLFDVSLNQYALQTNTFVYLTNTKDLIPETEQANKTYDKKFYLYGNPSFYSQKVDKELLLPLDGAEKEIIEIDKILKQFNQTTTRLTGKMVTEDTLRSIQMPYVLHISTHGYFMERKTGNELISNPMLNSGLCLVSSGNILDNKEIGHVNQMQGILTASEVMDMNFSKTNLVVLSACETGRGEVQVGEGVYGLQRAFLVAGAKAIILSLFKVDDEATKLLMVKFYSKLLNNGGDFRKAFREAKDDLRQSEFKSPIYWGAFIMVEGKQHTKNLN
jgi:CHAT domain-containing protein